MLVRLKVVTVVERAVDQWAQTLYQELQALYDTDPGYFQNASVTVPMANDELGVNPDTAGVFSPFDILFHGPAGSEWGNFDRRLTRILSSETRTRKVLGDSMATAMFSIMETISSRGLQLGFVGGSIGWTGSGPWTANFCEARYCLKVHIKADRTFEFVDARDDVGNQVPQMSGVSGWAGGFGLPASESAFERMRRNLESRGIPVTGNSSSGWLTLICIYADGALDSCHTQIQRD